MCPVNANQQKIGLIRNSRLKKKIARNNHKKKSKIVFLSYIICKKAKLLGKGESGQEENFFYTF
jgi:hypothetical protein